LTRSIPPRPPCVERVVSLNNDGAEAPPALPRVEARELYDLLSGGTCVIDARAPETFDSGHITGALNLPAVGTGLGTRAGWVAGRERSIVIVAESEQTALWLAERLYAAGVWDLTAFALADVGAWESAGIAVGCAPALSPQSLVPALRTGDIQLIDVRDQHEWLEGHVSGSTHLPLSELRDGRDPSVPNGPALAVACARGPRAALAASVLRRVLDRRVARVIGGIPDLARLGVPLVTG
jgi:hydroxyacylglutathione hydrolase